MANEFKRNEEFKQSEEMARKLQDDLDELGFPVPTKLSAERQRELDKLPKQFTV